MNESLVQVVKQRVARRLVGLHVDEVASVDRGAGVGTKVRLIKRAVQPSQEERPMFQFQKVIKNDNPETVRKAVEVVWHSIAKREMENNPGMTWKAALNAATRTTEFSDLHKAEKLMRFGPGY